MEHNDSTPQLGILDQRRIEANVIKPIYERMKAELGKDRAREIIGEAIKEAARAQAADLAAQSGGSTSLVTFRAIQPLWTKGDALRVEEQPSAPNEFNFNVTRCRYAEMYREMGLAEIGDLLSCNRDEVFIEGYAPNVEFKRTQTIMNGASHCDFRFTER